jgi:hypothetical protein
MLRLGAWLPFERVAQELRGLLGVSIGRETIRRRTEAAGATLVAVAQREGEELARTWPWPQVAAGRYQVSVDGAMVPLVHGQWAEVKTLVLGRVERQWVVDGTETVRTTALSYFSRLASATTFRRLAWVETHRRGITRAADVCAVTDGAPWCQRFVDWHCPDAVRILDFAHAAEYVSAAARAVYGADTAPLIAWLDPQLHELKYGDPDAVLRAVEALPRRRGAGPTSAQYPRDAALRYLRARRAQIRYAEFLAAGYPIGSGAVESANKLVVEARLKGSGMHWARGNVNPMLALREALCSDRWAAAWATLTAERRRERTRRRAQRHAPARRARLPAAPPVPAEPPLLPTPASARRTVARLRLGRVQDGRPTADHPWRKPFFRRQPAAADAART